MAQEASRQQRWACHVLPRALAAKAVSGPCPVSFEGCGCKGGSGFRSPSADGRKGTGVSYKHLVRVCGEPPHARCTAECYPVQKGCEAYGVAHIARFAKAMSLTI